MTVLGIDLGATNVRIGFRGPAGQLLVVPAEDGSGAAPAAVWFAGLDEVRVGRAAADAAIAHPDEVVTSVRAELLSTEQGDVGRRRDRYFHGRYQTPEAVARQVFTDAAQRAEGYLHEPARDVLLGVPSSGGRGAALRSAASATGLVVRDCIAEPVAVALHYGAVADGVDHLAVIYDLGGATLDVSVLRIRNRNVEILHTVTEPVGGSSWDAVLAEELMAQARRADPGATADGGEALRNALVRMAEELRVELSETQQASRRVRCAGVDCEVRLDRERLEQLTAHLMEQTVAATRAAVEAACGSTGERPDMLLLAGGGSRMPMVAEALGDRLGVDVRSAEPELAVVSGLTLAAGFGPLWATHATAGMVPEGHAAALRADPDPVTASARQRHVRPDDPDPGATPPQSAEPAAARAPAAGQPSPTDAVPSHAIPPRAPAPAPDTVLPGAPAPDTIPPGAPAPDTVLPDAPAPDTILADAPAPDTVPPRPAMPEGRDIAQHGELLSGRPVEQLRHIRREGHLLLTWIWPDGSLAARVQWHADGDPADRYLSTRCSRRGYEHDGGFELPIGRGGATITVEALVPGDDLDDRPPSELRVEPLAPIVTYDPVVHRGRRQWTATVTFTSDADCTLPAILVVRAAGGYRPSSRRDGEVVQEIPARQLSALQTAEVSFSLRPMRGPCWLVCFPADEDIWAADLRPAALNRLKVQ